MESADRPGLLVDLVKIITDVSIAVESGEFDTEVIIYKEVSSFILYLNRITFRCSIVFGLNSCFSLPGVAC